jgi:crotonobetainyl-CoA:carnitine CoA-transferase CaiB-like acyl-CoA transferase
VATIIAQHTAQEWQPLFAKADCCVTIVASLEQAMSDPHFIERGLFAHHVAGEKETMPALPVPVDPQFRGEAGPKPFPSRKKS